MRSDLQFALRNLNRNPRYALVAILSIALGIAATTVIFSFVHAILLAPLPFAHSDRLIAIEETDRGKPANGSPVRVFDWLQAPSIESVAAYYGESYTVEVGEVPERISGIRTFGDLPGALRLQPALGRGWTPPEARGLGGNVLLMSDRLWRMRFGADPTLVGRPIRLNGEAYLVTGILAPGQAFEDADLIAPEIDPKFPRASRFLAQIGRLRPGITLAQARTELQAVATRLSQQYPATDANLGVSVMSMQERIAGEARTPLLVLLGAVGFVLLMACLNVANLVLARNAARRHEFAVRRALGAGTGRLVRLLLTESLLVASFGGIVALGIGAWGLDLLVRQAPPDLPRLSEVRLDGAVLAFACAVTAVSGLLTGLIPALRLSAVQSQGALRTEGRATTRGTTRQVLVGLQVALSVVLLAGGGLLFRTLWNLETRTSRIATQHLVTFRLSLPWQMEPAKANALYSRVLERVASLPGVGAAALTDRLPFDGDTMSGDVFIAGEAGAGLTPGSKLDMRPVSPNYPSLMGAAVVAGRHLDDKDMRSRRAVINQAAARRYFSDRNPVGERIALQRNNRKLSQDDLFEIVGVISDLPASVREPAPRPSMYIPYTQSFWPLAVFVVRTHGDPGAFAETLRREVAAVDPTQALERIRTVDEFLASRNRTPRLQAWIVGTFAGAALLLAAIGVYGVVAGCVADRRLEIGIRIALGAKPGTVLANLLGGTIRLTFAGVAAGITLSAVVGRVLESVLFGVSTFDPVTYAASATALIVVAAVSAWLPARTAASLDPAVILRREN